MHCIVINTIRNSSFVLVSPESSPVHYSWPGDVCYNHVCPYLFSLISMDLRLRCLVLYLLSLTRALISDSWTPGCVALYLYLALTPYDSTSFPFLDISALLTVYKLALNHHSHSYISSLITMLFFTLILLGFTWNLIASLKLCNLRVWTDFYLRALLVDSLNSWTSLIWE
jgi:hypothetical protein